MVELVVGVAGMMAISFLAGRVITVNWQLINTKGQRDSAYKLVSKVKGQLKEAEDYITKLEGGSDG